MELGLRLETAVLCAGKCIRGDVRMKDEELSAQGEQKRQY